MSRRRKIDRQVDTREGDRHSQHLSPVMEHYVLCLYRLWEDSEAPTIVQLIDTLRQSTPAEWLDASVPPVAALIRRMQKQGLVDIGLDKRVWLTSQGLERGADITRRHRLAECLVVQLLGIELHRAHIEAHCLEHGMSPELEERLIECLNHPKKSPFGRPIPGTGEPELPANSVTLDTALPNITYVIDRIPEEDENLLSFLVDALIIPGREIQILEDARFLGVMKVSSKMGKVSIGYRVAQQIVVLPV